MAAFRFSTPRAVFSLYAGLGALGLICLAWTPAAMVCNLVLGDDAARRIGRQAISTGFRLYLWVLSALGACRFELDELDRLRGQGAMIVAPNHPCLLDAVMVLSRFPDLACIMKAALVHNVFLGVGARLARYIPNAELLRMVRDAVDELRAGRPLLLFPEATRSERFPLGPVSPTVALIARKAGVPVQTVIIETDSKYLTKGWPLFRRPPMPIVYRVRLGKRFDPPRDVAGFTAELEAYFADELRDALLPDTPANGTPRQSSAGVGVPTPDTRFSA